ncbi:VWA domain-containing protein [Streptomyces sp. NA04227]|uniref:substrate-binding and VWA domain-containing protein n=1 Tax=Streptomyces sp. NA04227 TaxID=2742136 RepID=UPI001591ACB4|nr:substrate-binding and VWA domain-containing protein [Streptomyces sp. NA04227]QKW05390.1 VWA domain-containing protein [Streptomyces sp. NA04227]
MGRHNLPEEYGAEPTPPHPGARRRYVAIAAALVLSITAAGVVSYQSGWLSSSSCTDEAVRLDVVAAPDVAPALREAADYSREQEIKSDGHCMDIHITAQDSYRTANDLHSAKKPPKYEVWVPDSQMWVQGVQGVDGTGGTGTGVVQLTPAGNVAASPLAMAARPEKAEQLGWPDKTYSWSELADSSLKKGGLRLSLPDPGRSATGLFAMSRLAMSEGKPGGKPDKQREARGATFAKYLRDHVADPATEVLDTLAGPEDDGKRATEALIVSEQAAFRHNAKAKSDGDVNLFHPEDGSPQLDYPYTLVDEPSMTTDESRAALRFMTLLGEEEGRRILREQGFRTSVGGSATTVATAAGSRSPQPYDDEDATQPSPGDLQESLGMWTITVKSVRLTSLADVSSSMAQIVPEKGLPRLTLTKNSFLEGLKTFTDHDEIGLWKFGADLDGDRDFKKIVPTRALGEGSHRDDMEKALEGLTPSASDTTGLYDAVLAAYQQASSTYVEGKFNAVVIVTDGSNDTGPLTRSALLRKLRDLSDPKKPLPVITVALGPEADKDDAEQIASATGGTSEQVSDPTVIQSVILKAIMTSGFRSQR